MFNLKTRHKKSKRDKRFIPLKKREPPKRPLNHNERIEFSEQSKPSGFSGKIINACYGSFIRNRMLNKRKLHKGRKKT